MRSPVALAGAIALCCVAPAMSSLDQAPHARVTHAIDHVILGIDDLERGRSLYPHAPPGARSIRPPAFSPSFPLTSIGNGVKMPALSTAVT